MAEVHLICGMICSGKSFYAQKLKKEINGIILSTDEITLALPGEVFRDCFDRVSDAVNGYLMRKSLDVLEAGVSVILDWGFWKAKQREDVRRFFADRGISCIFHYLEVDGRTLVLNAEARNRSVEKGETLAYYVDQGLAQKCSGLFEPPEPGEIDVWVDNRRQ